MPCNRDSRFMSQRLENAIIVLLTLVVINSIYFVMMKTHNDTSIAVDTGRIAAALEAK